MSYQSILEATASCPLSFNQLLVVGKLSPMKAPRPVREIASHTHLGMTETELTLSQLRELDVVEEPVARHWAMQTTPEAMQRLQTWFLTKPSDSLRWHQHFHSWICWYSDKWPLEKSAVWSYVFSKNRANVKLWNGDVERTTRIEKDKTAEIIKAAIDNGELVQRDDRSLVVQYKPEFGFPDFEYDADDKRDEAAVAALQRIAVTMSFINKQPGATLQLSKDERLAALKEIAARSSFNFPRATAGEIQQPTVSVKKATPPTEFPNGNLGFDPTCDMD